MILNYSPKFSGHSSSQLPLPHPPPSLTPAASTVTTFPSHCIPSISLLFITYCGFKSHYLCSVKKLQFLVEKWKQITIWKLTQSQIQGISEFPIWHNSHVHPQIVNWHQIHVRNQKRRTQYKHQRKLFNKNGCGTNTKILLDNLGLGFFFS